MKATSTFATAKESADYVARLLPTGTTINGMTYNTHGHSNFRLKSHTYCLMAARREDISVKIDSPCDFSKIKSVGKLAKRIALMFPVAEIACEVRLEVCEDIPDVETKDYDSTNGYGVLASDLAKTLVRKIDNGFRNTRYIPSDSQIRYPSYKCVLMMDPAMKGPTQIKFRKSMRRFKV